MDFLCPEVVVNSTIFESTCWAEPFWMIQTHISMKNGGFNALQTNLSTKMVTIFCRTSRVSCYHPKSSHDRNFFFKTDWEFGNIETSPPPHPEK